MNIVFVFGSYPYKDSVTHDGGADYLRNLAEGLAAVGHNVFVITSGNANTNLDIPISINKVTIFPLIFEWGLKGVFSEYKKISRLLKEINSEVINVIYPDTRLKNKYVIPLFMIFFAKGTPIITTLFHFLPKGANLFYALGTIFLYLTTSKLHFHDEGFKAIFDRFCFPLRKKSFFIPVGCNIEIPKEIVKFRKNKFALKEKLGLDSSARYVSFFGYWYPSKGVDLLIKAMNVLVRRGINVNLLLIGGHSIEEMNEYERSILDLIGGLGLSDRVITTGYCSDNKDVVSYMLCSDVCVFPFRNNMIGRSSIMLPIAVGVPIIITRLVKESNFFIDGENAVFVDPGNSNKLAEAIEEVLNNEALRVSLSSNLKKLHERISWKNITREWERIYDQTVKS